MESTTSSPWQALTPRRDVFEVARKKRRAIRVYEPTYQKEPQTVEEPVHGANEDQKLNQYVRSDYNDLTRELNRLDELSHKESMRLSARTPGVRKNPQAAIASDRELERKIYHQKMRRLAYEYDQELQDMDALAERRAQEAQLRRERAQSRPTFAPRAIYQSESIRGRYPEQKPFTEKDRERKDRETLRRWDAQLVENAPYDQDEE